MKKNIFIILIILSTITLKAQNDSIYKFTIDQAIDFAYENNLNVTNSQLEVKKAKWKIWETTAIGLPRVDANAQYQNYPDIPTQLMPNFMAPAVVGVNMEYFGLQPIQPLPEEQEKMAVKFGSEHNADWGVSISQLIFSGEYIVGLQASKAFKLMAEQNLEKAKIELKSSVEQSYYLALIASQSLKIMQQNYDNIKEISENTQKMVDAGVTEQTQADQIKILELNLKNQISSIKRQKELSILMLKFQLGLVPQDSLVLTDSLNNLLKNLNLQIINENFNIYSNIDYKMTNTQLRLKTLELRRAQSKTLPTLSAFYSYSEKAMQDEFDFFEDDTEWFPTSVWGVKLQVPIFSSGQRAAVIQQKKIEVYKTKNQQDLLTQQLNIQYSQAKADYLNAYENFLSQKKNLELSKNIYQNTQKQYKQGAASSMDLTQFQNQYLEAEANYYQALLQLLQSKTELKKLFNK